MTLRETAERILELATGPLTKINKDAVLGMIEEKMTSVLLATLPEERYDEYRGPDPVMPDALRKACIDPFGYVAYVNGLGVVSFCEAKVVGDGWIRLITDKSYLPDYFGPGCTFKFSRGVDVRVEDIRWVADCPGGS